MRIAKSDICLEMDCWVEELSPAQLAAYEKVANEHNAVKNALRTALNVNEGKELFNGEVFQAYSFKGRVLQELKEATIPKKSVKASEPVTSGSTAVRGRKRASNYVFLASTDEDEDDMPLAKRIAAGKKAAKLRTKAAAAAAAAAGGSGGGGSASPSPQLVKSTRGAASKAAMSKIEKSSSSNIRPSEITSVGGLVIGTDGKDKEKESGKESKLQGKTFPSLVVLAKPCLKVKESMAATRAKLDSKVKLVLMLTPNKFTEWLIQEGFLKSEQKCATHRNNELKLGVYSDASKFPYTGGYVWISECCPTRFVSVFHGSIFEGSPHPPSCILKLIYHWSCQTNIQNVVQWVKVDNVYIKGVYTWLRAVCTLAVHQKFKKLGGPDKYVEVGVISLGTTSQDGQQRQVKVEVLGVLDYTEKTLRLRAVEPISDSDRNYKKRFQTILEPLSRWVHKDSIITIDLTVDKSTLVGMGFKNIIQAAPTDTTAKHTNITIMDYLRRIVPRMFQNTLSLLSRQMIQQFLDELVWREQYGTYALQAFNSITTHIAEQTRMNTNETLTQRLLQVATNPFKDWSALPANYKETPANNMPKRLKKPFSEADFLELIRKAAKGKTKKESAEAAPTKSAPAKRRSSAASSAIPAPAPATASTKTTPTSSTSRATVAANKVDKSATALAKGNAGIGTRSTPHKAFKKLDDVEEQQKGLEEMYYGIHEGQQEHFEWFPYKPATRQTGYATKVWCPVCELHLPFDSNTKLQMHLLTHIDLTNGSDNGDGAHFPCRYCLAKHATENERTVHEDLVHPIVTRPIDSSSYNCLICSHRASTLPLLLAHMQKMHSTPELPYVCQACGYCSSSQRDLVRHFYDAHKQQNFLQCPFCLDIFHFTEKGILNKCNIHAFVRHLRVHASSVSAQLDCPKCVLHFLTKGALRQHLFNHHISWWKNMQLVRPLVANSVIVPTAKIRSHHRPPIGFSVQSKFGDLHTFASGSICLECHSEVIGNDHYSGMLKCNKCTYQTSCERSMFGHSSECNGIVNHELDRPLGREMYCVCGFATSVANVMATHLATCGQRTAYPSTERAYENTVKRNMLDMLGLVRREHESSEVINVQQAAPTAEAANEIHVVGHQEHQPSEVTAPSGTLSMPQNQATDQTLSQTAVAQYSTADFRIDFAPSQLAEHTHTFTSGSDIDMPLIGELNQLPSLQPPAYLGAVNSPFYEVTNADQPQRQQQQQQQQPQ